jgi:hypothetical protein
MPANRFKLRNFIKSKRRCPKWTVLIYADGNNDLEPEIYQAFQTMIEEPVGKDITLIIQMARAPRSLVRLLRPCLATQVSPPWEGVRRYLINHRGVTWIDDLGNLNMADPYTLANFLTWGLSSYPADHTMVILSGHGAGFVGAMTDYTHHYPVIMSVRGLSSAFGQSKQKTGKDIDLLVLDACYTNMVEIWYEFALTPQHPVRYLLAPLRNIPLQGLPCHLIIRSLQASQKQGEKFTHALARMVTAVNTDCGTANGILAAELRADHFNILKQEIDALAGLVVHYSLNLVEEAARWFTDRRNQLMISLLDLSNRLVDEYPAVYGQQNLQTVLADIIPVPPLSGLPPQQNLGPGLYLPATTQANLALLPYYHNLLFAQNNRWVQLLQGNQHLTKPAVAPSSLDKLLLPPPVPIPVASLVATILEQNPGFREDQAWQVVQTLGWLT